MNAPESAPTPSEEQEQESDAGAEDGGATSSSQFDESQDLAERLALIRKISQAESGEGLFLLSQILQIKQAIKESQKVARAVSIRLALLASSFGSFAWMLTLWVTRPADAGLLYDLTIAFFGVISVVFFLAAFKDELRNKFKSWFKRWRGRR